MGEEGREINEPALHLLDLQELRIEPKELKDAFLSFYGDCMLHKVKPLVAAIEKKSTGVTLISVLESMRGLQIREVKRTKASGSKTARFLEMQPLIAAKLITLPEEGKHNSMYVSHMIKITANDTHRHDDIADATYDACKIALIDKTIFVDYKSTIKENIVKSLAKGVENRVNALNRAAKYV